MNFSSMLCLAFANAEGFMSLWKPEDQGVPATNDLTEIEDLTLTAPSPLQRLLSDEDDEEQEEKENQTDADEEEEDGDDEEEEGDEDDGGIDKWSTPQVAGAGIGGLVLGGIGVFAAGKILKSSPEKRLLIEITTALNDTQKAALDSDTNVEYAEGTIIISTYKSIDAFTAKHAGITVHDSAVKQVMGTYVKCGELTLLRSTADNKWEVLPTEAEIEERLRQKETSKKLAEEAKKAKLKKTSKKLAEEAKKAKLKKTETTGPVQDN